MALTMKWVTEAKAICLFQEDNILEIIECDPNTLTPISSETAAPEQGSLSLLDDPEIQTLLINTLVNFEGESNEDDVAYLDKIKLDTIRS